AHDAVRAIRPDGVHVRGGDQLGHLVPRAPDEPALAASLLVALRLARVARDLRPGIHRVAEALFRLAPEPEQFTPDVREPDPGRGVGVPGERGTTRAAPRLVLRGVRPGGRVVGLLGLPGDDAVLDVHLP